MHINWNSRISLPVYEDPWLTNAVHTIVRSATDDNALAAFLHYYEGALVELIWDDLEEFLQEVETEDEYVGRMLPQSHDSPTWKERVQAAGELRERTQAECAWARHAVKRAEEIWNELREETGYTKPDRFQRTPDPKSFMEEAIELERQLTGARHRLTAAIREHASRAHVLALREAEFLNFLNTRASIGMEELHAMSPRQFESVTATLARRDGLRVLRDKGGSHDLGADVIALTHDSQKIVFQCKHRQPGSRAVGSRTIQTLNGTARPVHEADIVVAVTNGSFSKPASDLAAKQGIHLVWGFALKQWGHLGRPPP